MAPPASAHAHRRHALGGRGLHLRLPPRRRRPRRPSPGRPRVRHAQAGHAAVLAQGQRGRARRVQPAAESVSGFVGSMTRKGCSSARQARGAAAPRGCPRGPGRRTAPWIASSCGTWTTVRRGRRSEGREPRPGWPPGRARRTCPRESSGPSALSRRRAAGEGARPSNAPTSRAAAATGHRSTGRRAQSRPALTPSQIIRFASSAALRLEEGGCSRSSSVGPALATGPESRRREAHHLLDAEGVRVVSFAMWPARRGQRPRPA